MTFNIKGLKLVLTGVALSMTAIAIPIFAQASSAMAATSGNLKPIAGGEVVLSSSLSSLSNSSVTPLNTVNTGGGTWSYGTTYSIGGKGVYSNYIHPTLYHSSTAIIGSQDNKSYATAGSWSYASAVGSYFDTGYAYWNTY